jgi:hypothetical protein
MRSATEVPRTYDKLIQLLLEDSWAEMLIPREILLGDTPLEPGKCFESSLHLQYLLYLQYLLLLLWLRRRPG